MNSIFEAANMYLHYRGGKHVGLAGLVGVIVAIIIAIKWDDWFQPIVNFIGLDKVAHDMGIVVDGAGGAAATTYNVFILIFFFLLTFSFLLGIGLLIFVYASTAITTKVGSTIIVSILIVFYLPIFIIDAFTLDEDEKAARKRTKEDPEGFKEELRLKKNKAVMNYLIHTKERNGKTNKVRKEHAVQYLHRLPSLKEKRFLVGITYDREAVLLFPRPFGMVIWGSVDKFIGVPLTIEKFIEHIHDPSGLNRPHPKYYHILAGKELNDWDIDDFEEIVLPKGFDIEETLASMMGQRVYEDYVEMANKQYGINKNNAVSFQTVIDSMFNNQHQYKITFNNKYKGEN